MKMNERLLREWVRSCLVEQAQILTIAGAEDDPEKRYALSADQAKLLIRWIETGKPPQEFAGDDLGGTTVKQLWEPVEPYTSKSAQQKIFDSLDSTKQGPFKELIAQYGNLATQPGGILDTLTKLIMEPEIGPEGVAAALFAGTWGAPPTDSCSKVNLGAAAILQPLFHVRQTGTGNVVGKGEVLLAFAFPQTSADPGGDYDVTIGGAEFHVKDLGGAAGEEKGSDPDVPLGRNDAWGTAKATFPFKQLAMGGAPLDKLSKTRMQDNFDEVQAVYDKAETGDEEAIKERDGTIPFKGKATSSTNVATHFSEVLDKLVADSDSFGKAGGVIYALNEQLWACGKYGSYFNRTDRSALRVGPKTHLAQANRYPYSAIANRASDQATRAQKETELQTLVSDIDTDIRALGQNPTDKDIKILLGKAGQGRKYLAVKLEIPVSTVKKSTPQWDDVTTWSSSIFSDLQQKLEERKKMSEVSHGIIGDLRSLIRENLLLEELTKSDKKEIEKLARKQAMAIMDKEGWDKKEIEKLAKKQADDAIKKALGVSFLGRKGDINQFVSDVTQDTAEKWLKNKGTQQQVADITKRVVKRLYKDLAMSSPQIIDRIKV